MRLLILLVLILAVSPCLLSQNIFDIKKPAGKKETTPKKETISKPATVVNTKPAAQIIPKPKDSTPVQIAPPVVVKTPSAPLSPINQSNNPFDIKANGEKQTVKINVIPPTVVTGNSSSLVTDKSKTPPYDTTVQIPSENKLSSRSDTEENVIDSTPAKSIESGLQELKQISRIGSSPISKNLWFAIFLFLLFLAAIAMNFNRLYPVHLIKATYNQNQLRIMFKDSTKGNHLIVFGILYLLFVINGGIFLYLAFKIFNVGSLSLFMAILIILTVYLLRHFILYAIGRIFPIEKESFLFNYTVGIHNLTIGLGLMIVNILLAFVDPEYGQVLVFSGISIILALYLMRQVRGLLNFMPLILSRKLHFIIYLCTVEIAPWMLLIKFILK